jgi:hypothetical protein
MAKVAGRLQSNRFGPLDPVTVGVMTHSVAQEVA